MIIDFTEIVKNNPSFRAYGGVNGIKKGVLFKGNPYMLKIEYNGKKNSILSEYISSKVYSMLDIPTQEVILGKIYDNEREKLCVACKDFKEKDEYLYEFLNIKNSVLTENSSNGFSTELIEILEAIDRQNFCPSDEVRKRFWTMFIVDAYLGNFNRHNGNWGFLVNEKTGTKQLAPIFDCASCLYPEFMDEQLQDFLNPPNELDKGIYTFPKSVIKQNGKRINYHEFFQTTLNNDCLEAVKKIIPKIEKKSDEIKDFINGIEVLTSVRKQFYIQILKMRREKILQPALKRADYLVNK
ncbi:Uncharacterised protein [Megamonas hypermegale]|uniref:Uncharacterized protein n=1 Tax=Megamonas hypermegale TaxID=158847 RepID=A0A378PU52_9FIRM|nr:hypothetical protein [Megamonas hypermegale]STY91801.1 Uncharacterised protein [Megamonas hypermegale]